jgi:hypothetical protein
MTDLERKITLAERYFSKSKYKGIVERASKFMLEGDYGKAENVLATLPTEERLLNDLIPILKGKSVFTTLKKAMEGKVSSDWTSMKGLSSLCTHCIIECERGNTEYLLLVDMLNEKIGKMLVNAKSFDKSMIEISS